MALGMYGIYLRCDVCNKAEVGGHEVTKNPEKPLNNGQGQELRKRAQEQFGWRSVLDGWHGFDVCPDCKDKCL